MAIGTAPELTVTAIVTPGVLVVRQPGAERAGVAAVIPGQPEGCAAPIEHCLGMAIGGARQPAGDLDVDQRLQGVVAEEVPGEQGVPEARRISGRGDDAARGSAPARTVGLRRGVDG